MSRCEHLRVLARYNRWMNDRLYALCAEVSDAERREDRGAFFRSIHGTLNHLLLADRIWLARFRGEVFRVRSLADELCADFATLRREREKTDDDIDAWVTGLSEAKLDAPLVFTSVVGTRERSFPLWVTAAHFFNHQTHHRGQLTTLLAQIGRDPGVTDLMWLPGEDWSAAP